MQFGGGHGRHNTGGSMAAAATQGRNLLQKGEIAIIPAGVESWAACGCLINTVHEEVKHKKNCIATADAAMAHALTKLPDGGTHHSLLKQLWAGLESERAKANCQQVRCLMAVLDHVLLCSTGLASSTSTLTCSAASQRKQSWTQLAPGWTGAHCRHQRCLTW